MNVAVLVRVSKEEQATDDRLSIPAQLREIRSYCEREGWTITAEYLAEGFSAFTPKLSDIPPLHEAVLAAERREFAALVIHDSSRLARMERLAHEVLDRLSAVGVKLVNMSMGGIDYTTPEGRVFFNNEHGLNAYWSRKQSFHIRKAKRERFTDALPPGRVPYGYQRVPTIDRKTGLPKPDASVPPAIVPEEAEAVRLMFRMWTDGYRLVDIADRLNEGDYPPPAFLRNSSRTRWYPERIHYVLRNSFYQGDVHSKGVTVAGKHKAIIDRETWQRAQQPRHERGRVRTHDVLALSHIAVCATCGGRAYQHHTSRTTPDGSKRIYAYYREKNAPHLRAEHECPDGGRVWAAHEPDAIVRAIVEAMGGDAAWLRDIERAARKPLPKSRPRRAELAERLKRLQEEYLALRIDAQLYETQRRALQAELDAIPEQPSQLLMARDRLTSVADAWDVATARERNELARELFQSAAMDFRKHRLTVRPWPELAPIFDLRRAAVCAVSDPHLMVYQGANYSPADLGVAVAS